jgi:hypothetical protein
MSVGRPAAVGSFTNWPAVGRAAPRRSGIKT